MTKRLIPITISFEPEQVEALSFLVKTGKYANRAHATRVAVQSLINSEKLIESEKENIKRAMERKP